MKHFYWKKLIFFSLKLSFFFFLISPFICIFWISLWAILGLSSLHVGSKNQLSMIQKHRRKLQLHTFKTKLSITGTQILLQQQLLWETSASQCKYLGTLTEQVKTKIPIVQSGKHVSSTGFSLAATIQTLQIQIHINTFPISLSCISSTGTQAGTEAKPSSCKPREKCPSTTADKC